MPYWLHVLSITSLILAGISAVIIVVDIFSGHRQQMWIMEIVWPATALYWGPWHYGPITKWAASGPAKTFVAQRMKGGSILARTDPYGRRSASAPCTAGAAAALAICVPNGPDILVPP